MKVSQLLFFLLVVFVSEISVANSMRSPLALNLVPPAQVPSSEYSVTGARFSLLWGRQRSVFGLDFGLLGNVTDNTFTGIAISGLFNLNYGEVRGIQIAGLSNINSEKAIITGFQISLLCNYNSASSTLNGFQLSLLNLSAHTTVRGFQLGLFNTAKSVSGFQIGLINVTNSLTGLQIGLLNFNHTGLFSVAPIINFGW